MRPTVRRSVLLVTAVMAVGAVGGCAGPAAKLVEIKPVHTGGVSASPSDGYYADAVGAIERRDYARALDLLQLARDRSPTDVRVLNAFGVVYDKLGRFDLSARYYGQAAALDPKSTIVAANLAYSRELQGETVRTYDFAPRPAPSPAMTVAASRPPREPGASGVATASVGASALAPRPITFGAASRAPGGGAVGPVRPIRSRGAAFWETRPPLVLIDATGRGRRGEAVRAQLAQRGWSAPRWALRQAPAQRPTTIVYPSSRRGVAHALAVTLPFRARLIECKTGCVGVQLVIGTDALLRLPVRRVPTWGTI